MKQRRMGVLKGKVGITISDPSSLIFKFCSIYSRRVCNFFISWPLPTLQFSFSTVKLKYFSSPKFYASTLRGNKTERRATLRCLTKPSTGETFFPSSLFESLFFFCLFVFCFLGKIKNATDQLFFSDAEKAFRQLSVC